MTEDLKVKQATEQLEAELVGPDKEYPVEEALYILDEEAGTALYKPEVFNRYVEIYNSLSNE